MKTHKRFLDGKPIVDAKKELRVFLSAKDIANAVRRDPAHCAFSNACRRLYGSHTVAFFRTIAYVDLVDKNGSVRTERFVLPAETSRRIIAFDRRGKVHSGGYLLIPPKGTMTLDGRMVKDREYRASGMRRAAEEKRKARPRKKEPTFVRSGRGQIQFLHREKASTLRIMMDGAGE